VFGITQEDIEFIDSKIENQKRYLENFSIDFGDKSVNMLDNTYSANLNPKKYFSEINNRVNSMFNYAKDYGLKPVFVTLTAPSKYHKGHYTPNEISKVLTQVWNKFTNLQIFQKMKKELNHGLVYFRVYEPHKSGVPHLHAMIFLPSNYILPVKKKFKAYFSSDRLGTNLKAMDYKYTWYKEKGGATAYIMKYITKTFKDEQSQQIEHAIYWYIKHKIRRFLTSRTLAPLTVYRKIRYYFKNHYKDDFNTVTNMVKKGYIRREFNNTSISMMYYNIETGEVEDIILWNKNPELLLNARKKPCKPISLKYTKKTNEKEIVKVNGVDKFIFSKRENQFVELPTIPNKLGDYSLQQYFMTLENTHIENLNLHHYGLVKNEMIKRGLLVGEIISLNEYGNSFDTF